MREIVLKMGPKGRLKSFIFLQVEQWMQEQRGVMPTLLSFFSFFWKGVVWLRHQLYQFKIIQPVSLRTVTVNIGSIAVGGVGKTPLVMRLLEDLASLKGAVLLRGYEKWKGFGDEASMIARKFPGAQVRVGKNRVKNGRELEKSDVQFFLLDDGWQYRKLKSDFAIAVLNKDFTKEAYLPRGRLRDIPSRLKEADLVVITHPRESQEHWKRILAPYTSAPIVFANYSWKRIIWMDEEVSLLPGDKVAIFCGIGNPQSFFQLVQDQLFKVVYSMILKDHEKPLERHLNELIHMAKESGAKAVLCTEKDFIKLEKLSTFPIGGVEISYNVIEGDSIYQSFIGKVKKEINARSES